MMRWLIGKITGVDPVDVGTVMLVIWAVIFATLAFLVYKVVATRQLGSVAKAFGRGR